MKLYSTLCKEAEAERTIERSRFIAHVRPVSSREEADAFIGEIKKKYKDATHNVPAMVIGDKMQIQWASDDGEPQGTSGAPIVRLLTAEGITDTVVVVTRYFGGIKLGTGGLVRAYTSSVKLAIEKAGICDIIEQCLLKYVFDYTFLAKIQSLAGESFAIENIIYSNVVEADLSCLPEKTEEVKSLINSVTSGKARLAEETTATVKKEIEKILKNP